MLESFKVLGVTYKFHIIFAMALVILEVLIIGKLFDKNNTSVKNYNSKVNNH